MTKSCDFLVVPKSMSAGFIDDPATQTTLDEEWANQTYKMEIEAPRQSSAFDRSISPIPWSQDTELECGIMRQARQNRRPFTGEYAAHRSITLRHLPLPHRDGIVRLSLCCSFGF